MANLHGDDVAAATGREPRDIGTWVFIDPTGQYRLQYVPGTDLVPGHGTAWTHWSSASGHDIGKGLEKVGDPAELPKLLAPIPADASGQRSYYFEQLLVQHLRQKEAEATANAWRRGGGNSSNHRAGASAESDSRLDPEALWQLGRDELDAGRPSKALRAFQRLYALDHHWPALLQWLVMASAAVARVADHTSRRPRTENDSTDGCETVEVGSHFAVWPDNEKRVVLGNPDLTCPSRVNQTNWLLAADTLKPTALHYNFEIEHQRASDGFGEDAIIVRRGSELGVTITHGWEVDLHFRCCLHNRLLEPLPASTETADTASEGEGKGECTLNSTDDEAARDAAEAAAMAVVDHYHILGLRRSFTRKELKQAYHQASVTSHPDRAGGSHAAFSRAAAANECLVDQHGCKATFDKGGDLQKPNVEHSFAEVVKMRYYPELTPFRPFGDPETFAARRKGKAGYNHLGPLATPPPSTGRGSPAKVPAPGDGNSLTAWLDLSMSAARISDALRGVTLTAAEIQELLRREAGYKNRRFVTNLLEQRLADLTKGR